MSVSTHYRAACTGMVLAVLIPVRSALGAEHADFEGYPVASHSALAASRGGFEVRVDGQWLALAFSLERVSYLNGELLSRTRVVVPDITAAILSPLAISATVDAGPGTERSAVEPSAMPFSQPAQSGMPSADAGSHVTLIQNGAGNQALPARVNQGLEAAHAQILQAYNHATIIQNSLDNQVIQNLTTLNVTLTNAAFARAIALASALSPLLSAPVVLPR